MTPTPIELLAQAKAEWGWSPEELPALLAPALTGKQSISMLCDEMTLWTDIEDDHDSLPGTATLTGPAADYGLLADYALVALKITHTALAESLERERGLRGALSDIRVEAWGRRLPTKRLADLIARPSVVATAHPLEEK